VWLSRLVPFDQPGWSWDPMVRPWSIWLFSTGHAGARAFQPALCKPLLMEMSLAKGLLAWGVIENGKDWALSLCLDQTFSPITANRELPKKL